MIYNLTNNEFYCLEIIKDFIFLSICISSLQNIVNAKLFYAEGILSWNIVRLKYPYKFFSSNLADVIFSGRAYLLLNVILILLLVFLVFRPVSFLFLTLLVVYYIVYFRSSLVTNGSNQVNSVALLIITISQLIHTRYCAMLGINMLAVNSILCYFTSGYHKVFQSKWRSGFYLKAILFTRTYSLPGIANNLNRFKYYGHLSVFIIIWELSFLISPVMPGFLLGAVLTIGVTFHLFIGVVMGLNTFIWSFIGTYPAILFLNHYL